MTGTGSSSKDTFFSMSTHMWQSSQILRIVAAFLLFFSFFLYVQLNVMTISAETQDKSYIGGRGKEEKLQ